MSRRRTALAALVLAALAGSCESSAPSMTDQPAADLLIAEWPRLHRRRPGDGRPGRRRCRQHDPPRRNRRRSRGSTWAIDTGDRRARRHRGAGIQRLARALPRWRVLARQRGPRRGRPPSRSAGQDTGLRCRQCRRRVGRRARLALFAVPWRYPDQSAARCGRRRSPGGDGVLRRPQHLGELASAGDGRHHERHAESGQRRRRERSEDWRADRASEGIGGGARDQRHAAAQRGGSARRAARRPSRTRTGSASPASRRRRRAPTTPRSTSRRRHAGELRVRTYLAFSVSRDTSDADVDRMDAHSGSDSATMPRSRPGP